MMIQVSKEDQLFSIPFYPSHQIGSWEMQFWVIWDVSLSFGFLLLTDFYSLGKFNNGVSISGPNVQIVTMLEKPNPALFTYYFRANFTLNNVKCYSFIALTLLVNDGVAVYLNNAEIVRENLPEDVLHNQTYVSSVFWCFLKRKPRLFAHFVFSLLSPNWQSLSNQMWLSWRTYQVPLNATSKYFLVEGRNSIAVETHRGLWSGVVAFDARISATRKSTLLFFLPWWLGSLLSCFLFPFWSRSSSCASKQPWRAEICDGLDNNLDGTVSTSRKMYQNHMWILF